MTIISVSVRPTHRYFMNKSKSDIIYQIEQMKGETYGNAKRTELMRCSKNALSMLALTVYQGLPER